MLAPPVTGKTLTSLHAARQMIQLGFADAALVLTDLAILREQWTYVARKLDLNFTDSLDQAAEQGRGLSLTLQGTRIGGRLGQLEELAARRRLFIIADDVRFGEEYRDSVVERLLARNRENRALFLARTLPPSPSFDTEFRFDAQYLLDRSIIELPDTEIRIAQFSPSFPLLRQLQRNAIRVDDLSWREFEKLIAALLEREGYNVELMQGSKDGGVDVVAIKDLGAAGYFKALWQAKKQSPKNKVGISVIANWRTHGRNWAPARRSLSPPPTSRAVHWIAWNETTTCWGKWTGTI